MRLAIVITHPVQYYAPLFKLLNRRGKIMIRVFYTWGKISGGKYDPGFKRNIEWDIPLTDGYPFEWVKNDSRDPGSHHFQGIRNPELIDRIREWQPGAILIYGWAYHSHLKAMRYFKNKIPVIFRGDSTLLDEKNGIKGRLKTILLKWVYHYVDFALYTGVNNKAYFKKYGLKEPQLYFAPHAIDNERFAADHKREAELLRMQLGIAKDDILILFAGKLEAKKAPMLLLKAFVSLNDRHCHLLFIGNGHLENQVKAESENAANVHFMDFQNQSQMPVFYQACDLFCLPSNGPRETWGLAVNEAMACGKAILASDKVGSAADLVKGDTNGTIFKAGSLADLTNKLNYLVGKKKAGLIEMGVHSSASIKNWTIEIQAEVIETLITSI